MNEATNNHRQFDPADWLMLGVIASALALFLGFRLFLASGYILFDPDEAMSSLAGATFLNGGLPYVDVLVHRGPLLYLWHGIVLALSNPFSYAAVHWACIFYAIGCSAYLLNRVYLCFGRFATGATAVALLALATVWICDEDLWALNADVLMGATAAVGSAVLLRPTNAGAVSIMRLAVAGLLFGLAFTYKQSAFVFAIVPGAVALASPGLGYKQRLQGCIASGLAFIAPAAAFALLYLLSGHWAEFWEGFYGYNSRYAASNYDVTLETHLLFLLLPYGVFALFPLIAALRLYKQQQWHNLIILITWIIAAVLVATATARSWANYLWPIHFVIAMAAGISMDWLWQGRRLPPGWRRYSVLAASVVCGVLLATRISLGAYGTIERIDQLSAQSPKKVGGLATIIPDPEVVREIIDTAGKYTAAGEPIFVMGGYAPEIHMLTERPPASRFVTGNFIEEYYPGTFGPLSVTRERIIELLTDLETTQPRLIFNPCVLGYLCNRNDMVKETLQPYLDANYTEIRPGVYLRT